MTSLSSTSPSTSSSIGLLSIFIISFRAVIRVATLTLTGIHLYYRNMIKPNGDGKQVIARFVQQLALPALYFSKIISCDDTGGSTTDTCASSSTIMSNSSTSLLFDDDDITIRKEVAGDDVLCPNLALDHLNDFWILILWPLYVVGCVSIRIVLSTIVLLACFAFVFFSRLSSSN